MLRLLLLSAVLFSSSAYGQGSFLFDLNAYFFQKKEERSNSAGTTVNKYESNYQFLGLGICFQNGPWCFGGKYLRGDLGGKNDNGLLDGSIVLEGFGLSAGYVADGFVAQATYLIDAEKRFGDDSLGGNASLEYPASEAYMLDLGYGFNAGGFLFGPNLKWFQFKYKKRTLNGQSQDLLTTEKDDYLLPMLSIWTFF